MEPDIGLSFGAFHSFQEIPHKFHERQIGVCKKRPAQIEASSSKSKSGSEIMDRNCPKIKGKSIYVDYFCQSSRMGANRAR